MRALTLVALVLAAAACGKKTSPPPATPSNQPAPDPTPAVAPAPQAAAAAPDDPAFDAMMHRALTMFGAMGAVADQAAGDCNRLADGLDRVMLDHQVFIAEAKLHKNDPGMDKRAEAWMKEHNDEMMPPLMKLAAAAQKCVGTPKFDAAMQRFQQIGS